MNFWNNKNVFVTGGTGFIGTWLVKDLVDNGADVTCLVKDYPKDSNFVELNLDKKTNLVFGDMLDLNLIKLTLEKYNIDTVFHLAAQPLVQIALKNPLETIQANIMGTLNILDSCRLNNKIKRIVVASSDKAYGPSDKLPYDETFPLRGIYPYDVSKSCTDLIASSYGITYNMPIAITRLSNVYGGGDLNFDRIIPETIKHILHNENILIRSNGKFTREFFYVKDAANAYLTLAEKINELNLKGDAFNFGTDQPIVILDLVKKIIDVSENKDAKIKILDTAKAEIKDQYLSSEKAKKTLDWEPKYSLEKGLKETYLWYKNYFKNNKNG
ncbi:MAG: GDP-mannose 4,6-dehydratase [Nanoarchaeota archaeon]|nr:GDP-mannose 4,6-dehydratase [Nanoarchaeota archaeon]MBU0962881.1 GDP-mannose 4,6-dehydratase [Nanoarchaeota archaeon]